jgi:hypothetical protein
MMDPGQLEAVLELRTLGGGGFGLQLAQGLEAIFERARAGAGGLRR